MDAIFYGVADLLEPIFGLIAKLGNLPNAFFIICGLVAFLAYTRMLFKYRRIRENE